MKKKANTDKKKFTPYWLLSILALCVFFGGWYLLTCSPSSIIPTPVDVVTRFFEVLREPIANVPIWEHILVSLRRVFGAFLAAAVLGILFGVLLGWFKTFRKIFSPLYNLLRPIPPIAWIPIIVLLFGIGELPKMIIVFIGAFTPIVFNTYSAVLMVDPLVLNAGIVLGANERQLLFQVALPDCIPSIIAGLKTAMSIAWMCVVAAEMIVSRAGVGFLINRGMENSDTALVMVSMVVIAAVSATITFVLNKLEEVLCPWLTIGK